MLTQQDRAGQAREVPLNFARGPHPTPGPAAGSPLPSPCPWLLAGRPLVGAQYFPPKPAEGQPLFSGPVFGCRRPVPARGRSQERPSSLGRGTAPLPKVRANPFLHRLLGDLKSHLADAPVSAGGCVFSLLLFGLLIRSHMRFTHRQALAEGRRAGGSPAFVTSVARLFILKSKHPSSCTEAQSHLCFLGPRARDLPCWL